MSSPIGGIVPTAGDISGTSVVLTGTSVVTVSGNQVFISGQPVLVSGQLVVVSGIVGTSVSGNVVEPISGAIARLHGLDLSGNQWLPVALTASGKNRLAISIYDVANANSVTVGSAADSESNAAALKTRALLEGYDFVNDQFVRARVTASGQGMSGIVHRLAVAVSGDPVTVSGNAVAISGQAVLISGQTVVASVTTNISGQVVYLTSGKNDVQVSGQVVRIGSPSLSNKAQVFSLDTDDYGESDDALFTAAFNNAFVDASGTWVRLRSTQSGRGVSGVPHRLVVAFSGDSVSISGQPTSVSGNAVSISGQAVLISGQTVVASVTTNISGQTVYPVSGNAYMHIYDYSGQQWRAAPNLFSGDPTPFTLTTITDYGTNDAEVLFPNTDDKSSNHGALATFGYSQGFDQTQSAWRNLRVTRSGTANPVSGIGYKLIVAFSGDPVSISGQPVTASGDTYAVLSGKAQIMNTAGTIVSVVAPAVDNIQGSSNPGLITSSVLYAVDEVQARHARLRVTASGVGISGIPHRLVVALSGDPVSVSGNQVYLGSGSNNIQVTEGVNVVNVITNFSDAQNNGDNGLTVDSRLMGYNEESGDWKRVRITSSGKGISGIPHKLVVAFSGDIAQIGQGGNIANVNNVYDDVESVTNPSLFVTAYNVGRVIGGNAIAMQMTVSGQAISGIGNRLVVALSGDPVTVSGNMVSVSGQTVLVSGVVQIGQGGDIAEIDTADSADNETVNRNRLCMQTTMHAYDVMTSGFARLRATSSGSIISGIQHALVVAPVIYDASGQAYRGILAPASGSNALTTAGFTPPTFTAFADNVVPASGGILFAMQYRSGGSTITVKKLFLSNLEPQLASGQYIRFDICRISGLYSGSTQITAFPLDPNDGTSGASLNIESNVTGSLFPTAARNVLFTWADSTQGWMSGAGGMASTFGVGHMVGQATNVLPESFEQKELRLTSGYGFIVQQTLAQTGYTQVTSGRFGVTAIYTIQ